MKDYLKKSFGKKISYITFILIILILYSDTIYYGFYNDDFRYQYTEFKQIITTLLNDRHLQVLYYFIFYISNLITTNPILGHAINIILFS